MVAEMEVYVSFHKSYVIHLIFRYAISGVIVFYYFNKRKKKWIQAEDVQWYLLENRKKKELYRNKIAAANILCLSALIAHVSLRKLLLSGMNNKFWVWMHRTDTFQNNPCHSINQQSLEHLISCIFNEDILKTCSLILGTLSCVLMLYLEPPSTVSGSAREALGMSTKGSR